VLQNIKLDDREYVDIREEAISNIVKHCPEWTNHNASDPGITLIELFSGMSEMILYRLNQVPQKNYLAFLDLIGIKQRLPIPSKTNITLSLTDGYQADEERKNSIFLKKESVITTEPQSEEEAIVFETTKDLYMSNLKLLNVYSKKYNIARNRDDVINHTDEFLDHIPFRPFDKEKNITNHVQIYLESNNFQVLQDNVKATLMFRLPTTMREYNISQDFLKKMQWQYFDGFSWIDLDIVPNYKLIIDDDDADVLTVTFVGNNENFEESNLEIFGEINTFHIRGIFLEVEDWLRNLTVYEISVVTNSDEAGILADGCYHNYEQLDMNNDFYPFGGRPKVDDIMQDEAFIVKCDEAFGVPGAMVSLEVIHSLNPEYNMAKASTGVELQIVWEYPVDTAKWNILEITDSTECFTKNGEITFKVPKDIQKVVLNGEEGYWIRAKISTGNYGEDEKSEYNEKTGNVTIIESTLRPPLLEKVLVHYTLPRVDLENCSVFNNFKYTAIEFDKNRPVLLFKDDTKNEEALIFGFDSYLSNDYLDIYFNIDEHIVSNLNTNTKQRVISWEILKDGKWEEVKAIDNTEGLTRSGDIRIELPLIEKLESLTVYHDELKRFWLKARVTFNALSDSPIIKNIMLNSVEVSQKETFRDEFIGRSVGLPDMKFKLNYKNLVSPPIINVGDDEFIAVDRLIDYGKDDKVFRFNGITGDLEFGNGKYGAIPELGLPIVAKEYSVTQGLKGNIPKGNLKVLRESINYVDSVTNILSCRGAQNGDSLDDLKKYAPSVLKTMERAVTIEDYQLLAENFSPFIEKAKCSYKDNQVIIIVMTSDIMETNGFININLITELQNYLEERSLITTKPIVIPPKIVEVKLFLKLKYTNEKYSFVQSELSYGLFKKAQSYYHPLTGYDGIGYPLGRNITKGDIHNIINETDSMFYMHEMRFKKSGSDDFINKVTLSYNEIIKIVDVVIEDISYDI
jgi:hypothetical protein